jgi:protocatechuate 3,4-dioxygenase beta subunit
MIGAAVFAVWWAIAQAPAPIVRDGVITGQVVDATTGKPVSAAIVALGGAPIVVREYVSIVQGAAVVSGFVGSSGVPRILTGADGRFVFRNLPKGSFTITATKSGYSEGASGRRRPGGGTRPVVLADTDRTVDVAVRVWKNAVITGTVTDEAGEPVVSVSVRALGRTLANGKRVFVPRGGSASTDDRGSYRFSNLPPGDYIVVVSPPSISAKMTALNEIGRTGRAPGELGALLSSGAIAGLQFGDTLFGLGRGTAIPPPPVDGRLHVYPPTFHPSAFAPSQAATITLAAGEERAGVDVQLQPVGTARVSGTVTSASATIASAVLRLVPAGADGIDAAGLASVSAADPAGAFVFPAVVPGQYSLRAVEREGTDISWLDVPVTVAGNDVDGIVAVLRPGLTVRGRFEYEGAAQRPQGFISIAIGLDLVEGTPVAVLPPSVSANTGAATSFTLQGFIPGKYVVRVSGSPVGWMFKSAMLNGVDVSATPFEMTRDVSDVVVTFTDRWSGIGGAVQGNGADGAIVAVFPVESQAWTNYGSNPRRLRSAPTNAKGQFGLSSVPPGDYYLIAIPEEYAEDWRDPRMLEALARMATQVTILEGEHKMIDLRVQEVPR